MLLSRHARIEELLVVELTRDSQRTAKQLHRSLTKKRACSLVAIYKALNKLEDDGIVLKLAGQYSLNISWILELRALANSMQQRYLGAPETQLVLPAEGEQRRWSFEHLPQLNVFWAQLISLLTRASESKLLFDWVPYPFFCLIDVELEERFLRGIHSLNAEVYRIIGGSSYLYTLWQQHWSEFPGQTAFAPGPFEKKRDTNILVTDDYVLTVRIDQASTARLDSLYSEIQSPTDIRIAEITQVLLMPVKARMVLERRPRKARRLKKRFVEYFGLKPSALG